MSADTLRTLILVLLSAATVYLFLKKKISETLVVVAFAVLLLFDLVSVDRQYVNNDNFVSAVKVDKPYQANVADKEILKDKGHFRVLDMSSEGQSRPGRAAYFHNSLFGYSAARMGRYNELLDFHVYKNNMNVINMLNTKYIIAEEQGSIFPYTNTDANGNAWFVEKLSYLSDANSEIMALDSLDTKRKAVTSMNELSLKQKVFRYQTDSTSIIQLKAHLPNYLKYESSNKNDGLAVFSENYYHQGWNAYIDGNLVPHMRVNYVLRALEVPKGMHTIEFKFEAEVVETGSKVALASSAIFGLLFLLGVFYEFKQRKAEV